MPTIGGSCDSVALTRTSDGLTVHIDECMPGKGVLDYGEFLGLVDRVGRDVSLTLKFMDPEAEYAHVAPYARHVANGVGCYDRLNPPRRRGLGGEGSSGSERATSLSVIALSLVRGPPIILYLVPLTRRLPRISSTMLDWLSEANNNL